MASLKGHCHALCGRFGKYQSCEAETPLLQVLYSEEGRRKLPSTGIKGCTDTPFTRDISGKSMERDYGLALVGNECTISHSQHESRVFDILFHSDQEGNGFSSVKYAAMSYPSQHYNQ